MAFSRDLYRNYAWASGRHLGRPEPPKNSLLHVATRRRRRYSSSRSVPSSKFCPRIWIHAVSMCAAPCPARLPRFILELLKICRRRLCLAARSEQDDLGAGASELGSLRVPARFQTFCPAASGSTAGLKSDVGQSAPALPPTSFGTVSRILPRGERQTPLDCKAAAARAHCRCTPGSDDFKEFAPRRAANTLGLQTCVDNSALTLLPARCSKRHLCRHQRIKLMRCLGFNRCRQLVGPALFRARPDLSFPTRPNGFCPAASGKQPRISRLHRQKRPGAASFRAPAVSASAALTRARLDAHQLGLISVPLHPRLSDAVSDPFRRILPRGERHVALGLNLPMPLTAIARAVSAISAV
uniref:Uncharacterized protein n=1 Tax=Mycena chlorophos TaxID=658473 RepID=A0ABQ0L1X4_MYCCL|nr:predicted protein [Mycena chlorophos]